MRAGELIFDTDPEYPSLYAEFEKTMKLWLNSIAVTIHRKR